MRSLALSASDCCGCPATSRDVAADVRRFSARFRSAQQTTTVDAAALLALEELKGEMDSAERLARAHIDRVSGSEGVSRTERR